MDTADNSKEVIGRSAGVTFVDYSEVPIPAKVDTGAYSSAIHASDIHLDDAGVLHFRLCGGHPACQEVAFEAATDDYRLVNVENSFGDGEDRYVVKLRVKIGEQEFITPFTLADRQRKIYPILLGRKTLRKRYIVDVTKSGVDRLALKEAFRINLPPDEEMEEDLS